MKKNKQWALRIALLVLVSGYLVILVGGISISQPTIIFKPVQGGVVMQHGDAAVHVKEAPNKALFFWQNGTLYLEVQRTQNTILGKTVKHSKWSPKEMESLGDNK